MTNKREPEIDLLLKHAKNFVIKKLDEITDFAFDKIDDAKERQMPHHGPLTREQRVDAVLTAHALAGKSLSTQAQRFELRDNILAALDENVSWSDMTDKP